MKKKLEIISKPPLISYLDYAYILSIMDEKITLPWFYSNFIQLCYNHDPKSNHPLRFYEPDHTGRIWHPLNPWVNYQIINKDLFNSLRLDITEIIINSINLGHYVLTFIDEFYIPKKAAFKKYNFPHAILIYGYDTYNKSYDIVGFNNKSQYVCNTVTFSDFENAYTKMESQSELYNTMFLMAFNKKRTYNFDVVNVLEQLSDYINSKNSSIKCRSFFNPEMHYSFGIDVYNCLLQYLCLESDVKPLIVQPLHLLWEHKKLMLSRINYLETNKYINEKSIIEKYRVIENNALICRNMFLKYKITNNNMILNRISEIIKYISETEKYLLHSLYEDILRTNKMKGVTL